MASAFGVSGEHANNWFHELIAFSPYAPFVVCPLALILISCLEQKLFPGSQGNGIPQSIAALQIRKHVSRTVLLSFPIAAGKILLTLMGLLSGVSFGREAHAVHIGAAIIVFGKVGYVSSVLQTPITGFVIVIEMTDNHDLLWLLMATSFIAYGTSRIVCPESVYRALAENFPPR